MSSHQVLLIQSLTRLLRSPSWAHRERRDITHLRLLALLIATFIPTQLILSIAVRALLITCQGHRPRPRTRAVCRDRRPITTFADRTRAPACAPGGSGSSPTVWSKGSSHSSPSAGIRSRDWIRCRSIKSSGREAGIRRPPVRLVGPPYLSRYSFCSGMSTSPSSPRDARYAAHGMACT